MNRWLIAAIFITGIVSNVLAQAPGTELQYSIVRPRDLQWSATQLPGMEMATLSGDPAKEGEYVIRLKLADGTKLPPHWHANDEHITVMRGAFGIGPGILFDDTKLEVLQPGIYVRIPKAMRHFALAKGETVVQVQGTGPFVIHWVNPADVPALNPKP